MRLRLGLLAALNWLGHGLLALGLAGPCMTVTPRLGPYTGLGKWLGLLQDPETYSILTGVWRLMTGGNALIGIALLVFSVIFPLSKLVVLRASIAGARAGRPVFKAHDIAARLSKYSMVDIFVIALIVVASKSFAGGTTVEIRWGTYAFGAAALLSIPVAHAVGESRA